MKRLTSTIQKKFRNYITTASVITLLSFPAAAKAENPLLLEIGFGYESNTINRVNKIPLLIRDVPRHRDDSYAKETDIAPIKRDYAKLYGYLPIKTKVGIKSSLSNKVLPSIGIGLDVLISPVGFIPPNNRDDISERNYTDDVGSDHRGDGAALTYYKVATVFGPGLDFVRPSAFSELEVILNKEFGIAIGYNLFKERLIAQNGWDRYNVLEVKDEYNLADLVVGQPYLSFRLHNNENLKRRHSASINLGFNDIIKTKMKGLGENIDLRLNKVSWVIYVTYDSGILK